MMNRILSDHRRAFGDFYAVDFVDEQEVSRIRSKIDVDVPFDLHWTWEYGSEVEELRHLYETRQERASGTPRPTSTGRSRFPGGNGSCRVKAYCCCRRR